MSNRGKMTSTNWKKTFKGLAIAATGSAALGLLNAIGTIDIDNELLAAVVVAVVPALTNMIREWMKE